MLVNKVLEEYLLNQKFGYVIHDPEFLEWFHEKIKKNEVESSCADKKD